MQMAYGNYPQMQMPFIPHPHFNNYRKAKKISTTKPEQKQQTEKKSDSKNNICANTDRSPFKTTYISRAEEIELKSINNALYSQFHAARQSIYQQYKQKVDTIHRHTQMMSAQKRKLNVKIAAIDGKVQEKKLFLSYLEMSKPQPNSWLVSNSAMNMNAFARNISTQQQTTNAYPKPTIVDVLPNPTTATNQAESKEDEAKRVKKPKFSEYNVRVLRDWYETHTNNPYPSSAEKHLMCQLTGLTKYQVSRWFCNVRTRKPPPELSDNDEDIVDNANGTQTSNTTMPMPYNYHMMMQRQMMQPMPPHLQHLVPLTQMTPLNMPPMTSMNSGQSMGHQFNFSPLNQTGNMIPAQDAKEGLMPQIKSNFINSTPKAEEKQDVPPPLMKEN